MKNRILAGLLALCMLCGLAGCGGGAVQPTVPVTYTDSGICGEDVRWFYDEETQTLGISGKGEMARYLFEDAPWSAYAESIRVIVIEDGVTTIGEDAFAGCTSVSSVVIPSSVTSIEWRAFAECASLVSITIPNGATSIEGYAFIDCIGLTSVSIPGSVSSIGEAAFISCTSLTDIYYTGTEAQWESIDISDSSNNELFAATIHYNSPG